MLARVNNALYRLQVKANVSGAVVAGHLTKGVGL